MQELQSPERTPFSEITLEMEADKAETVGYKYSNLGYVLIKEEYFDQYEEMWKLVYDMDQYKIHYVHEPDVMKLVLGCEDMERLDLEDTVERIERKNTRS